MWILKRKKVKLPARIRICLVYKYSATICEHKNIMPVVNLKKKKPTNSCGAHKKCDDIILGCVKHKPRFSVFIVYFIV